MLCGYFSFRVILKLMSDKSFGFFSDILVDIICLFRTKLQNVQGVLKGKEKTKEKKGTGRKDIPIQKRLVFLKIYL